MKGTGRNCHIVALPYPGRGHINPMINLCKLLLSRNHNIVITFVVTQEWLGLLRLSSTSSSKLPDEIRFETIPNVIPSELVRSRDFITFLEAVWTKMEAPFEKVLDLLKVEAPPVTAILADAFLPWPVDVGNGRNIPVALYWPMSASVFSAFHHFDLLVEKGHFPVELSERGEEIVDYIPGLSSTKLSDLPTIFYGDGRQALPKALKVVSKVSKAQYLLLSSVQKLEGKVIDTLQAKFPFPVYPVGPTIPYFEIKHNLLKTTSLNKEPNYLHWLDHQPVSSVLYVSFGSFLSVSRAQMDEIVAGICTSGVHFLWVTRGDTTWFGGGCGDKGFLVPWCDQLRVLCHSSVGGFWTHCGINSTLEAIYAGVPMLTFPLAVDQVLNSKQIVEDWKIGWRAKKPEVGRENLVMRNEISELVNRFMDLDSDERKEMSTRIREVQEICQEAIAEKGSSFTNLDAFLEDISHGPSN